MVPNQCSVLLPVVIVQVDADGGQTLVALAADCLGALNGTSPATAHLQQLYQQWQAMSCHSDPVPICQSGPNQCIQQGSLGYFCFPN
jgi:hypothetical protein